MMNLSAGSSVFLIHSEAEVRQNLTTTLQAAGFQVESYASAEEFLDAHQPEHPGCVVLDLRLPKQSGLELLQTLARMSPPRPAIVVTENATVGEAIDAFRAGAIDFFAQPVSLRLLEQRLQAALAQDAPRRRHFLRWHEVQARMDRLTPAEMEVVKLLAEGLLNKQIAARLNVAVRTIELRRANIFRKMEVASLGDLLRLVIFMEIYAAGTPGD